MKKLIRFALAALFLLPSVSNATFLTQEVINSVMATDSTEEKTPIVKAIAEQVQQTLKQAETLNLKNTVAYVEVTNQHNKIKNKTRPTSNQLTQLRQLNNELDSIICSEEASYMNKFRSFALNSGITIKNRKKTVVGIFTAAILVVAGYIYRQKLSSFAKSLR
jgi:hypothetical protein